MGIAMTGGIGAQVGLDCPSDTTSGERRRRMRGRKGTIAVTFEVEADEYELQGGEWHLNL